MGTGYLCLQTNAFKEVNQHHRSEDNIIRVEVVESILKLLKYFGPSISNLNIIYSLSKKSSTDVAVINTLNKNINLQCSETLRQIEIENYHECFFDEMAKPFVRLENVTIRGQFERLGNSIHSFGELFPAMNRLSFVNLKLSDKSSIDRHFPQLIHFSAELRDADDPHRFGEFDVESFLKKNPQICSLELSHFSYGFLRVVNEILPELKSLELMRYNASRDTDDKKFIVFENVSIFTIYSGFGAMPENLHFKSLVEFHTDVHSILKDWWHDFVTTNTRLNRLYLEKGCVDNKALETLISTKLNLIQLRFMLCQDVSDKNFTEFVRMNKNILQVQVIKGTTK